VSRQETTLGTLTRSIHHRGGQEVQRLLQSEPIPDGDRNVACADLTRLRFVYRPAGVLDWDGQSVPYRERWQAIWRDDHQDVVRTSYPDTGPNDE
jgi:hypothetical protein